MTHWVNNVKKNNLTNSLFAVLLLTSPVVGADEKYPAADFQPEVVYQDKDYIAKDSQSEKTTKQSKNEITEISEVDTKYPAANFQPQVVYSVCKFHHCRRPVAESLLLGIWCLLH